MRTLSDDAVASQNAEQTDKVWITLVTIEHDDLDAPIRVCDNNEAVISNGETFLPYAFELDLAGEDGDRQTVARIKIDNTEKEIVEAIRAITTPPDVTLQIVLDSDPDTVEVQQSGLKLRGVRFDVGGVEGDLVFEAVAVEPIATTMNPAMFPAMF